MMSPEKKKEYDEKKMCRVTGTGMGIVSLMILIMTIWQDVLPVSFAYISCVITVIVAIVVIILLNTICKK